MLISKLHLKKYIENFLEVLNRENILSIFDIEKKLNERFEVQEDSTHFVSIGLIPSNLGTGAYTISYNVTLVGIPVEIKLNQELRYSMIIVKSSEEIYGYSIFAQDPNKNLVQNKVMDTTDLTKIKKELEDIVK